MKTEFVMENRELELARFIVEKTDSNLFLTGKAGTGKTTFLRDINRYSKKKHVVLAPTGVAAVNAGGMTIHSFFQFGFGPYVRGVSEPEPNFNMRKQKLELIRNLELLIIDEISMVRADLLDHINDELQRIRKNYTPFGGVQILMIGDLQQLPPIAKDSEAAILNKYYPSYYFFDSKVLRRSDYYCIELKSVYRQTDQDFIDLLNRARAGKITDQDLRTLNNRYRPLFQPAKEENYIRLVTHNRQAEEINTNEMALLNDSPCTFEAEVSRDFPEDSFPTSRSLSLKRNAQVMFLRNDADRRYVNGTIGTVEEVSPERVRVRIAATGEVVDVERVSWDNVRYRLDEDQNSIVAEVKGSFKQYPLKTAWAITVHKSQGLTFDRAIIDVRSAFSPGQAYVALSRCRTLDGIVFSSRLPASVFMTDSLVDDYVRSVACDVDALAREVCFEPFDYDRTPADADDPKALRQKKRLTKADLVNRDLFEALRVWRLGVSKEIGMAPFCVLYDSALVEIANTLPHDSRELLKINGMGKVKLERYGSAILEIVDRVGGKRPVVADAPEPVANDAAPVEPKRQKAVREKKIPTWEQSFIMFQEGKTVEEIAQERCLSENTILSHLSRYIASGELDIRRLVPFETIEKVAEFRRVFPDEVGLKPIFEFYDGTIPYGQIRAALEWLIKGSDPVC